MSNRFIKALVIASLVKFVLAQYPETDEEVCIGYEDGTLFQIEGTCTLYYYCVDQIGYIDDCKGFGDEYQFDPAINDCNFADQVGCIEEEPFYPDPDPPAPNPPPATQPPAVVTTQPPAQTTTSVFDPNNVPDVECPTDRPGEILFFESLNCTEYYVCASGVKLTMRCMDGFVWNPDEKQCDHPVYNPRCSNLSFDSSRNVKCNRHGFYTAAYPTDCTKYVFCAEGIPMIQVCPIGTAWYIDRCVASQYALCHDSARLRLF